MEQITSKNNRWVKMARELKSKKFRDREGRFLMEGLRSAEDAASQGIRDVVIFVEEDVLSSGRLDTLLETGKKLHWLFLSVSSRLMDQMAGTEHTQGILLIVNKPDSAEKAIRPDGWYVLLDHIQDPGNMGTILRTAAAAGVDGVLLTEGCTDPYSEKAVRSSMGSILRIPVFEKITGEDLVSLKKKGVKLTGTTLHEARPYREFPPEVSGILAFGNEGNGLSQEVLDLCDKSVFIPIYSGVESLNVTAAAAVLLFYNASVKLGKA